VIAFRHILCPVDFSDASTRALVYATAFAAWYQAQLETLHVVPVFDFDAAMGPSPSSGEVLSSAAHDRLVAELRRSIDLAGAAAFNPTALVLEGRVHETIVNRATAQPADLLVLGTHGRSGFNRLLLGSVSEKVLRIAPCPVLTVPPAAPATTTAPVAFKNILCPIDYSPAALKALQYALELGRQAGGQVTVLYALEYVDPEEPGEHVDFDIRSYRQQVIDHARRRLHAKLAGEPRTWCEIEEIVAVNRAYKEILQRAAASKADIIVMGAQGTGGLELLLYGSNTQHVVRAATCPVLTVRA